MARTRAARHQGGGPPIDRATPDDVIALATDVGAVPMQVGALLQLGAGVSRGAVAERVASRLGAVPRLRQRLERTPFGAGRPVWVDDETFTVDRHVVEIACPPPGDDEALLAVAMDAVTRRLPLDEPPWRVVVVTGAASAVVVVFHHVLADGIGGLAVLAELVDGAPQVRSTPDAHPTPSTRALYRDAAREWMHALAHVGQLVGALRDAVSQLRRHGGSTRPAVTGFNRPTGAARHAATVCVPLAAVVASARARNATVNDVVLAAVGAAVGRLVAERGEHLEELVVSVPVSARTAAGRTELGNAVGVMPIAVPTSGPLASRVEQVATTTREAKAAPPSTSSALLGPVFRILARLGLFQWFIDRQHLVHTFVTNLRGPEEPLRFLDVPITGAAALTVVTGNVTAAFAVLSYAGTLTISVITDPDACPDHRRLAELIDDELHAAC